MLRAPMPCWRRNSEVRHCAALVGSWLRCFGSSVSSTWVSVPASCPSCEPTPALLGSEQDVSCPAHSRWQEWCVSFLLMMGSLWSSVVLAWLTFPWALLIQCHDCSGSSPGDVCVGVWSCVLHLCLFQSILAGLRMQYPALLYQMSKTGPKLNF